MALGKKILITGATGFVGANLLEKIILKYPKSKIYILIRHDSNTWRIKNLLKKTKIINADLSNFNLIKNQIQKIQPNIIFHLATYGAYSKQNDLKSAIKTNITGTTNLLLALDKINYDLFVNTGSSSEYGYKNKPMKETDTLVPNSYYSATKASQTHIANTYGLLSNKPVITLRLFSVYGPYEEPGRFIPTVILNCLNNNDIDIVKGPTRDFIYVDDVTNAYIKCIKLNNFDNRILNICTNKQTQIYKVAKKIKLLTNSKSNLRLGTYEKRPWDTNFWVGENKLAKMVLNWNPTYDLENGLKKSIKWYQNNQDLYAKK